MAAKGDQTCRNGIVIYVSNLLGTSFNGASLSGRFVTE